MWAAEARRAEQWDHTACLMALIANCNRDPKRQRRPYTPAQFHPFPGRLQKPKPKERAGVGLLRALLVDGRGADDLMAEIEG